MSASPATNASAPYAVFTDENAPGDITNTSTSTSTPTSPTMTTPKSARALRHALRVSIPTTTSSPITSRRIPSISPTKTSDTHTPTPKHASRTHTSMLQSRLQHFSTVLELTRKMAKTAIDEPTETKSSDASDDHRPATPSHLSTDDTIVERAHPLDRITSMDALNLTKYKSDDVKVEPLSERDMSPPAQSPTDALPPPMKPFLPRQSSVQALTQLTRSTSDDGIQHLHSYSPDYAVGHIHPTYPHTQHHDPHTSNLHVMSTLHYPSQTSSPHTMMSMHAGSDPLVANVTMHWLTLTFNDQPELEKEFRQKWMLRTVRLMRTSLWASYILLVIYCIHAKSPPLIGATVAIGAFLALTCNRWCVKHYFHRLLYIILVVAGITRTFLEAYNNNSGSNALSLALFGISSFFLFQLRFFSAVVLVTTDALFYSIMELSSPGSSYVNVIQTLFFYACLMFFCGFVSRQVEESFRLSFLLQHAHTEERARTQEIIDNMLPRYVTNKLQQIKARRLSQEDNTHAIITTDDLDDPHHQLEHRMNHTSEKTNTDHHHGSDWTHVISGVHYIEEYLADEPAEVVSALEPRVSVLFCDILCFTQLAESYKPSAVVAILDGIYSIFDELCVIYGVQKMETVGKTYMAAAGIPGTRKDDAIACVEMGLEMVNLMNQFQIDGEPIPVRVGINSGVVISGVVGLKRPQFSLFGDTVNTASRMQSTGLPMRVHVSATTYSQLKNDYIAEKRQTEVKGKGVMTTYLIVRRTTPMDRRPSLREVDDDDDNELQDDAPQPPTPKNAKAVLQNIHKKRYGVSASASIKRFPLRFKQLSDEREFTARRIASMGAATQRSAISAIGFFVVLAVVEYYNILGTVHETSSAIITIFATRYMFVACVIMLIFFSKWSRTRAFFARYAGLFHIPVYTYGIASCLAVPIATQDTVQSQDVIAYIFVLILLSTGDTLRFYLTNVIINVASAITFAIVYHTQITSPNWIYSLFVCAFCVVNLEYNYHKEWHMRKEFLLTQGVERQRQRAERFLYQMIPSYVANELKKGHLGFSQRYTDVTILYSDIKGFTVYSASSTPDHVVKLLNRMFSAFDRLTDHHQVYKVQTIGDAYVVVSGFPFVGDDNQTKTTEQHAKNCVHYAQDMLHVIKRVRTQEGDPVEMRIGIHTGQVIGGCIGTRQLRFDIWGTDCLIANALESAGVPNHIVCSQKTSTYLRDTYTLTHHETITVKGAGEVEVYLVGAPLANGSDVYQRLGS